jgi:hypothetical protein
MNTLAIEAPPMLALSCVLTINQELSNSNECIELL